MQTRVQCKDNSTRSYESQFVHRAVSKIVKTALIKHCYNCETIEIYKVTLLNICEKLKMTQRDTGNIKSKVNETCCCEAEGADQRNGYGDKIRNGWG